MSNHNYSEEDLNEIADKAKDWALTNGFIMRSPACKFTSDVGQIAPFILFPTPFPKSEFDSAMQVQKDMNLLYAKVAFDRALLESSLASVIQTDQFTGNLMKIYRKVMDEGLAQPLILQIQRCDYMCSVQNDITSIKQVEVNNIASSFCGLASKLEGLHRYTMEELQSPYKSGSLPTNSALDTVATGIASAWQMFEHSRAIILVVVSKNEQNIADQRLIEYRVHEMTHGKALIIRLTLLECANLLSLDEESKSLKMKPELLKSRKMYSPSYTDAPVGVVYFRAGYIPQHYPSETEWEARLMLERSTAIKCPFIATHLAGTKKIQQVLAGDGVVEHFLPQNPESVARIRSTFAGMWGLETSNLDTEIILAQVRSHPQNYVLKPQLEGGGNNVYGEDIPQFINSLTKLDLEAYVLMERIFPPLNQVYFVRANASVVKADAISELGTYGFLIANAHTGDVLLNEDGGYLLRTKAVQVNEGGIMAGASALDSPLLYQ